MEIITSLDNKKVKYTNKLKDKKFRDEEKRFIVETEHLIKEAYHCNVLEYVFILEGNDIDIDIEKYYVSKNVMKRLSNLESGFKYIGVVKKFIPKTYGNRLLLLDGIQDPGNLGTMIRSAVAFNIDTIVLSNTCVDLYNDKVIRASEGMLFKINVIRCNLVNFINELKENNYVIYGTDVVNGKIVSDCSFKTKSAIVIGNEGNGLTNNVKELVNENIYIPMSNNIESLNASIAASIIMYEMSKKDYE